MMARKGPLDNLVVVDMTRALAGPMCGRVLKDMGARVIKVEPTGGGDSTRGVRPKTPAGLSHFFSSINFGKESIVLDLAPAPKGSDEDRAILEAMLAKADILIENFRPGVMKRLGLDWETLHAKYPRLIMGSVSGFGQTGPKRTRAGLDTVIQAASGMMSVTGFPDKEPVRTGVSISDVTGGLNLAIGIISAVVERQRTGEAIYVDVAMVDASLANGLIPAASYLADGTEQGRLGNTHQATAPFDVFRCKQDSFISIAGASQKDWEKLARKIGREDLLQDPRFQKFGKRLQNAQPLKKELEVTLAEKTAEEWEALLLTTGIPVNVVAEYRDIVHDEQVRHRNMVVELEGEAEGGKPAAARIIGNPIKLSAFEDPKSRAKAPELNEHDAQVREWARSSSKL